jgi:hypothetical protein
MRFGQEIQKMLWAQLIIAAVSPEGYFRSHDANLGIRYFDTLSQRTEAVRR